MEDGRFFIDNLLFTMNAVMPIVAVISVGYFLKQIHLFDEKFFPLLNKLCFRCCLPCLLFFNVYNVEQISDIAAYGKLCLYAVVSILIFFLLALVFVHFFVKDALQKGVMLQCAYRSNFAIIGISLAMSISSGDPQPVVAASILSSVSIPFFNVLAIIALSIFVDDENGNPAKKISVFSILKKIATNPLIIGVATGLFCLLIRLLIPYGSDGEKLFTVKKSLPFVYKAVSMLAQCASPVALIALGGNFTFSAVSRLKHKIIVGVLARTVICPVVCLYFAVKLGFSSIEFPALIALYGTPLAVSTVPMSAEMGSDAELAGQLVVWTTLASAFTLFIIIFISAQLSLI
ncbi:AEC family transporter [uncultured Treponema sp.]|uniref:AEC family transporter n=1 Tax=uncultured Treponema sp. TaxID=162155 RepID=UPI0025EE0173|nr:AEC family transporter [uncultured Treponema sp.]